MKPSDRSIPTFSKSFQPPPLASTPLGVLPTPITPNNDPPDIPFDNPPGPGPGADPGADPCADPPSIAILKEARVPPSSIPDPLRTDPPRTYSRVGRGEGEKEGEGEGEVEAEREEWGRERK